MAPSIEYARYVHGDDEELLHYTQIEDGAYHQKYKNHLFCETSNCNVKMRFTQKRKGSNFFSAWSNQATKHIVGCTHHVPEPTEETAGSGYGNYLNVTISDERVLESVKRKLKQLRTKRNAPTPGIPRPPKPPKTTTGQPGDATKLIDTPNSDIIVGPGNSDRFRLTSVEANYVGSHVKQRKIVYGKIKSAFFDENNRYGAIFFNVDGQDTCAYFPVAFYSELTTIESLKDFINIVNTMVSIKELHLVCAGFIDDKSRRYNINMTNPQLVWINGKSYYEITLSGTIPDSDLINI